MIFQTIDSSNVDQFAEGLSSIDKQVRGITRSENYWRWCYVDNPAGGSGSAVAVFEDEIAGKLGNVYLRLCVEDKEVVCGLLEGFTVKRSARSWQCYRGLAGKCYKASVGGGVKFGFSFATRQASGMNRQVGWASLGRLPIYTGIIDVADGLRGRSVPRWLAGSGKLIQPIVGLRIPALASADYQIREINQFDDSFDDLWSSIKKCRRVAVVKDADYLNWRYTKCPEKHYKCLAAYKGDSLQGMIAFCSNKKQSQGYVLDMLARDNDQSVYISLLSDVVKRLKNQGIGLIRACYPFGSTEAGVLKKLGFNSWASYIWRMELVVTSEGEIGNLPELQMTNWHFSFGDWLYY